MARLLVVLRKVDRRVVFACDPLLATLFESLWPPTAFSYFTLDLDASTYGKVHNSPDRWEWSDDLRNLVLAGSPLDLGLEPRKARILIALARSINRNRRVVLKADLIGQDTVYAMKVAEANDYQSGKPGPFLLLEGEAEICGITTEQMALMVLFRAAQATQYLRESELKRRSLTSRIVLSQTASELSALESEIANYETQF